MPRPPGSPNKISSKIKEALEQSFDDVGGVKYLNRMAEAEPKAYLGLLGKIIPKEIKGEVRVSLMDSIMRQIYGDKQGVIEHETDEEAVQ